ncbi:hypothetical protein E2I00_015729 [Balaenoptera physalus]|uniref:Caspase family p20 domain-containing protein n=1 Tax=Balaenoptera physalus TaxID=9770 RepID=A0A6A1Q8Y7_BALPH|nr:hypothetical protein E2I00_015729 [Balaenoptera physalus]
MERLPEESSGPTPHQVFCWTAEESSGATYCPVFGSSLKGALCLGDPKSSPSAQYDLSGARGAPLMAVIQDWPGAQHDALGFKTTLKTDPTAQAFQEEMAHFWEWLDACRGPVSCAFVALMAHGGPQGQLLGADRALWGRPKIFLLQVCCGVSRAWGPPWRLGQVPPSSPPPAALALLTQPLASQDLLSTSSKKPDFSRGPTPGSPNQADILMVYAATEGSSGCVSPSDLTLNLQLRSSGRLGDPEGAVRTYSGQIQAEC